MKRVDLIRAITALGAVFEREGSEHTLYRNPRTGRPIAVPRHREVAEGTARKILRDARAARA
jgi:mRNA interferase HicA